MLPVGHESCRVVDVHLEGVALGDGTLCRAANEHAAVRGVVDPEIDLHLEVRVVGLCGEQAPARTLDGADRAVRNFPPSVGARAPAVQARAVEQQRPPACPLGARQHVVLLGRRRRRSRENRRDHERRRLYQSRPGHRDILSRYGLQAKFLYILILPGPASLAAAAGACRLTSRLLQAELPAGGQHGDRLADALLARCLAFGRVNPRHEVPPVRRGELLEELPCLRFRTEGRGDVGRQDRNLRRRRSTKVGRRRGQAGVGQQGVFPELDPAPAVGGGPVAARLPGT